MCGGCVGADGRIRSGGETFCSTRFLASIDHGGRHHPTAAMRPHSRRESMIKSANKLGNSLVSLKQGNTILVRLELWGLVCH